MHPGFKICRTRGLLFLTASLTASLTSIQPVGAAGDSDPDFLLSAPRGSVSIRGGWSFANADSDIFDFTVDQLTVARSDFNAPTVGIDVARRWKPRLDIVFGIEHSQASIQSEFRDFVDQNGIAIVQRTQLTQVPLTGSLRYYLRDRGRAAGTYAWVPSKVAPYLGGGVGIVRYEFEQTGSFVDFVDLSIFNDTFISDGWEPCVQAFAGLDLKLTPKVRLAVEARYTWADSELENDFVGFEPIDLAGFKTLTGVQFLF